MLENIPEATPPSAKQKPDYGMFIGILGVLLAVLIPILQMNGLEINWECSAISYMAIIIGGVWTFLVHAVPHRGKTIRLLGSIVISAALGTLAMIATLRQYHTQHSPPAAPAETKVLDAVDKVGTSVKKFTDAIVTNQSDARLAILDTEKQNAVQEGNEIQKSHELLNVSTTDLESLRAEREYELEQRSNQLEQAAIQKQIDARNQELEEPQRIRQAEQDKQQADQEILKKEQSLSAHILPIFDYAIIKLNKMLDGIAKEVGEKRHADFLGETPTIYASNLVSDGRLVSGTNSISIGTNSAWNFEISTTASEISTASPFGAPYGSYQNRVFSTITISSRTTNGESILTLTPYYYTRGDSREVQGMFFERKITADVWFYKFSIKLNVPNGFNIDESPSLDESPSAESYTTEIDKALRGLIEAQDQQFPLTKK
jgi:hypothetical protein